MEPEKSDSTIISSNCVGFTILHSYDEEKQETSLSSSRRKLQKNNPTLSLLRYESETSQHSSAAPTCPPPFARIISFCNFSKSDPNQIGRLHGAERKRYPLLRGAKDCRKGGRWSLMKV
ncbi:hypothetical protein TNCT_196451 [Trichonephila clavata]|uniref:Uncharacterized protein n=1 Tax=Trichonephila clavata TaxID=2740835 RepID=A0A8X6LZU6_TRICU|nr:hypothetical protein TNCT_196451 [Trichonephila clavata]